MAGSDRSLTSRSFTITLALVSLTAALWSVLIHAIVPEPYLVRLIFKRSNNAHGTRMRSFILGKHRPISAVDGTFGTPSLPLLLACRFYQVLAWHRQGLGLTLPKRYLASWFHLKPHPSLDHRHIFSDFVTDASALRHTNFIGGVLLALLVRSLLGLNIEVYNGKCEEKHESNVRCKRCPSWSGWELIHTTINVYLFPPLFFFYGLYYTDVLSALSVLLAYQCYLVKQPTGVIFAGLLSLLFRQTNIFWVSVFLGGLELCRTIPKGRPEIEFPRQPTFYDVVQGSWQHASAYDPLISQACFEGHNGTPVMQNSC